MATRKLDIIIDQKGAKLAEGEQKQLDNAINKTKSDLRKYSTDTDKAKLTQDKMTKSTDGLKTSVSSLRSSYLLVAAAMAAVGYAVNQNLELIRADNVETEKLAAIIKATGGSAGVTANQMVQLAKEIQNSAGISNTMTMQAEALILTFVNISGSVIPRTMNAIADMSTLFGGMREAAVQLGKALNDPTIGLTALQRVGITFSETQKEMIKGFQESGDILKAQEVILTELENEFGGTARAIALNTNILKASFDDLRKATAAGLEDAVQSASGAAIPLIQAVTDAINLYRLEVEMTSEAYNDLSEDAKKSLEDQKTAILENAVATDGLALILKALIPIGIDIKDTYIDISKILLGLQAPGIVATFGILDKVLDSVLEKLKMTGSQMVAEELLEGMVKQSSELKENFDNMTVKQLQSELADTKAQLEGLQKIGLTAEFELKLKTKIVNLENEITQIQNQIADELELAESTIKVKPTIEVETDDIFEKMTADIDESLAGLPEKEIHIEAIADFDLSSSIEPTSVTLQAQVEFLKDYISELETFRNLGLDVWEQLSGTLESYANNAADLYEMDQMSYEQYLAILEIKKQADEEYLEHKKEIFEEEHEFELGLAYSAVDTYKEAFSDILVEGKSFSDTMSSFFDNLKNNAISFILDYAAEYVKQQIVMQAVSKAAQATAIASATATGAAISSAMATPAALTTLASFAANVAPSQAGIASTIGLAHSFKEQGFEGWVDQPTMFVVGERNKGAVPQREYVSITPEAQFNPMRGGNGSIINDQLLTEMREVKKEIKKWQEIEAQKPKYLVRTIDKVEMYENTEQGRITSAEVNLGG